MAGEKLALLGGPPAKATPYGTGKRFGERELTLLKETLDQETLFYTKGEMTNRMLDKFSEMTGGCFAVPVSSGTAGIHVALGAAGISYGDEVIIPPITDTGSAIGILAQNAIPVFCDIDPDSYLMTPELVEEKITRQTKAVVVVHLTGNPCDMRGFVKLARKHRLILIEDCAQAWGATYHGKPLGTFGDFGCFSLNDFKHISCGDGGIVTTRYEYLYRTAHAFADKFYDRLGTGYRTPSAWLGFNYRITELQSAVALAQLEKLPTIINRRHELGLRLLDGIQGIPGLIPQKITENSYPTFWFSGFRINEAEAKVSPEKFAEALAAEAVSTGQGYFSLLECDLFLKRQAYKNTEFPFDFPDGRSYFYEPSSCPNSVKFMRTFIRLNVNEFHTEIDIDETIAAVKKVAAYYQEQS
ncbi:DegT/DnrJ/EryC1/StrS family aminotransferase [bacterium]|nr:DegT/DnrJ/EryC1/StrS family aminotransferase [bacterium]